MYFVNALTPRKRTLGFALGIGIGASVFGGYKLYRFAQRPRVAVVIVIDQFAYHYIPKLKPFFNFGFKQLLSQGLVFHNAFHPHAAPTTATGHTAINAGTYAMDHAVVLNDWFDCRGDKIKFATDVRPEAGTFSGGKGYSGCHIMADTLSDQVMLAGGGNNVFAISLKPRSAVAMAGRRGHAVWFDGNCGGFTSSKAFFKSLPDWVVAFNQSCLLDLSHYPEWPLCYPASSKAYDFPFINNYDYAASNVRLAGKKLPLRDVVKKDDDDDDRSSDEVRVLMKTPHANKMVLDCAQHCIRTNYQRGADGTLLVWVSLSSLDMLGHLYGPDSREVVDMLYHLDCQIGQFVAQVQEDVGEKNVVFALTGDHGVARIPELAKLAGSKHARRISVRALIDGMNALVTKKYGAQDIVKEFKTNQFFLDKQRLEALGASKKKLILADLKKFLIAQPGIKRAWTYDQLAHATFKPGALENYYKQQLYQGRSGDLICMPQPDCAISKYSKGTVHRTPYEYDTHVPLVLYQKGVIKHKEIIEPVLTFQLPVTLAKLLGVGKPEGSSVSALL